jgi:peptidoglycan hydrolase-like protein with peptidoglycan-binding domain
MTLKYKRGGIAVAIGKAHEVSLPPRVFRARLECMHFDSDKSFLLPMSIPGIRNLKTYYDGHPGLTVLVNGHTDLVGDPPYNLQLSNERAQAVAAYLQNNVDEWVKWYNAPQPSKRWSVTEDQHMLKKVTAGNGDVYYGGPITGWNDATTQAAVKHFQSDHGLDADGKLGIDTRRALVKKYMELEGTSLPVDATLVMHGCGEFHPIDKTSQADLGNRRVEIFLFDGPVDPPPHNPCPAPGCQEYREWVGHTIEEVDLCKPAAGIGATFFVGTTQNDEQLALAREWIEGIVGNVGDAKRAQRATLLSTRDLLNQLHAFERTVAANEKLDSPPALGGIKLPTMVLITRALDAATNGPQAVRFYGIDDSDEAMTITAEELDHVHLAVIDGPSLRQAVVADDATDADLVALASLLDFLRGSSYRALYLCAVGGGRGVDQVAAKMATLIDKIIYFNNLPLVLTRDEDGVLAPPHVGGDAVAQGEGFQSGAPVPLQAADARSFLPGAERKATP